MSLNIDFTNTTLKTSAILTLLERLAQHRTNDLENEDQLVAAEFLLRLGIVERYVEGETIWYALSDTGFAAFYAWHHKRAPVEDRIDAIRRELQDQRDENLRITRLLEAAGDCIKQIARTKDASLAATHIAEYDRSVVMLNDTARKH